MQCPAERVEGKPDHLKRNDAEQHITTRFAQNDRAMTFTGIKGDVKRASYVSFQVIRQRGFLQVWTISQAGKIGTNKILTLDLRGFKTFRTRKGKLFDLDQLF
jgi:hypothetical protein